MNVGRVLVIASNVFREVIRDRILYLLGFFGILLLLANLLLPEVAASTEDKMLLDVGLGAIGVTGLVVAVFVGTGLVNKEIEKRTVYVLTAKPLTPAEFIVGKHVGLSVVLAVMVTVMTALYIATLSLNQIAFPLDSILLAVLFLFLELCLVTAIAILFGVFTSSLLAVFLTVAVYLMGHLSRDLVLLTELSESPNIQRITESIYLVLPDLSRLDLKNVAVYGMDLLPQPLELLSNAGYGLLYIVLTLAIATVVFSRREF
ncbi:ABC transporter permease [Leptolyngbya sp. CCY15150]|uniref:ABC transporter permease subunit n=1 Tax=Leptolyngbya sp. CCY15150 TaxID=2767772 RepID=UPI00194E8061